MNKVLRKIAQGLLIVPVLAFGFGFFVSGDTAFAASCNPDTWTLQDGANCAQGTGTPALLFGNAGVFSTVSNVLLFIVGAVAVIMIIIGGIRYVISGGDSSQVSAAKNTILYALVGVIVAILAYAAVNFVVASFVPDSGAGGGATGGSSWNGGAISPR